MSTRSLYELDASSTLFPELLEDLLHDTKWIDQLKTLPKDDLVGQAGHLNNVWLTAVPTTPRSLPHRFSMIPIARACHPGGVSACCGKFAVLGWFSPQRMKYLTSFRSPPYNRSHTTHSTMPIRGHSSEKVFVSSDFGYPPRAIRHQLDR